MQSFTIPELRRALWLVAGLFALAWSGKAVAAGKQGDFLQTDTLGVNLITRDMTAHTTHTVGDAVNLSEFVGLHYYAIERVRFGMNLQITERLWPEPPYPQSRIQRLALLPQVGWNFYDPFFAAVVFAFAPRSDGRPTLSLALQFVGGVSIPVSKTVSVSAALEVPWTYYRHQMLGLTALTGVSFRF